MDLGVSQKDVDESFKIIWYNWVITRVMTEAVFMRTISKYLKTGNNSWIQGSQWLPLWKQLATRQKVHKCCQKGWLQRPASYQQGY